MQQESFKVRDKRNKGWFFMDNEYLNGYAKILGPVATAIYVSLCRHANNNQECFPSYKLLAEEFNISEKTVKRHIVKLRNHNIVSIKQGKSKDGKFLSNMYILMDKNVWTKEPWGQKGTTDRGDNLSKAVGTNLPCKDTNTNNTNIDILSKDNISSKLPILIDLFKDVNPSYKKLFGNKTERRALMELVEQFSYEKIEATIKALPGIISKPYAPKITTPYQLQKDLGKLIAFVNQERGRQSKKGKEIIMTFNNEL